MDRGAPGIGKSHMLYILTKPKWMPMWLHIWREKRAWLRWNKGNYVIFDLPTIEPSDYAMPSMNKHIGWARQNTETIDEYTKEEEA